MEGCRELTKRVQYPIARNGSTLAPLGRKGGLATGCQNLRTDVPEIQIVQTHDFRLKEAANLHGRARGNSHPGLIFLLSDLLQGSSLTKPNWKPKVTRAHDVVHTSPAPRRKQGGEGRKVDLEATRRAGCVCEEATPKPSPGSDRMVEEGKEQGEGICSLPGWFHLRPWGLNIW